MRFGIFILSVLLAAGTATPAQAGTVIDPAGDFLDTYTGAQNGDMDILTASARLDGADFQLSAVLNGTVGSTTNGLYVFGVDRGAGTARFNTGPTPVGANILWDAVVVLLPGQVLRVVNFQPAGAPVITNLTSGISVNGNSLALTAPLSLLPSRGFLPEDYVFSMWTRQRVNPAFDSGNFEIADFAPNAGGFTASVPEPGTWAMLILGFAGVGLAVRRRRTYGLPAAALG